MVRVPTYLVEAMMLRICPERYSVSQLMSLRSSVKLWSLGQSLARQKEVLGTDGEDGNEGLTAREQRAIEKGLLG